MTYRRQLLSIAMLAVLSAPVGAQTLEDYEVMALSPLDERAVVKSPDNTMTVLKPGDRIAGTRATVKQVLTEKLVIEETVTDANGGETTETVWFYKTSGGHSRVERLRKQPPEGEEGIHAIEKQVDLSDG